VVESSEVVQLVRPRAGHFDLGTGYHGDLWLDLDALVLSPARLRPYVDWLAERLRGHGVDAVCGPFYAAGTMPSRAWPARECPLCADGVPVTPGAPITPGDGRSAPPAGR